MVGAVREPPLPGSASKTQIPRRITADRIADKLEIEVSQVRACLEKLHWVDVVRKIGLISYQGPSDPVIWCCESLIGCSLYSAIPFEWVIGFKLVIMREMCWIYVSFNFC